MSTDTAQNTTRIYRADNGKIKEVNSFGTMEDLINQVLIEDSLLHQDTLDISSDLPRSYQGLQLLHGRIVDNVEYILDPAGMQIVRSPEVTWQNRNCKIAPSGLCGADCKSLSVLVASQLRILNIPYYYKVVAYKAKDLKHIFPVAILDNKHVTMDTTMIHFDLEVPHSYSEVYPGGALTQVGMPKLGETQVDIKVNWKRILLFALGLLIARRVIIR